MSCCGDRILGKIFITVIMVTALSAVNMPVVLQYRELPHAMTAFVL
jgi:hypothetical protein